MWSPEPVQSPGLLGIWTSLTQGRKHEGWPVGVGALSSRERGVGFARHVAIELLAGLNKGSAHI